MKKVLVSIAALVLALTTCCMTVLASGPDIESPEYLLGDAQYVKGSGVAVSMTCTGAYEDFTGIIVDGATLSAGNYVAASGSTVVLFSNDYLETLSVGSHSVVFTYTDGTSNTAVLEVIAKGQTPDKKDKSADGKTSGTTSSTGKTTSPTTGENTMALYLAAAVAACACAAAVCVRRKRA